MSAPPAESPTEPAVKTSLVADFRADLQALIRARYAAIHVVTVEEDRALEEIDRVAHLSGCSLRLWSATRGLYSVDGKTHRGFANDLAAALGQFEEEIRRGGQHLLVLLDPYPQLSDRSDSVSRRRFREFCIDARSKGYRATILIVAAEAAIPPELRHEITLLDFPLPDHEEVLAIVREFATQLQGIEDIAVSNHGTLEHLAEAAIGLTRSEIKCALAQAIVSDRVLDGSDASKLFLHKQQIVRKSGILEYVDSGACSLDDVGGLANLKDWLHVRETAFSDAARKFGVAVPKGVLLTGVPGCGKSWSARCVAAAWGLPLVRLDLGAVFGPLVGSSEANLRTAMATCEAVAPCVLWIDEIEKGAPKPGHFNGDSGVSLRVLGSLITWMQEKRAPVFVVATSNDVGKLVPEMLRKGRFDEVFFVDLPDDGERREILTIHLRRRGRDPGKFDLDSLVRLSGPMNLGADVALTGAEIEAWINEALLVAFNRQDRQQSAAGRPDVEMADFVVAIEKLVPFARLMGPEIAEIRQWGASHAVQAAAVSSR